MASEWNRITDLIAAIGEVEATVGDAVHELATQVKTLKERCAKLLSALDDFEGGARVFDENEEDE